MHASVGGGINQFVIHIDDSLSLRCECPGVESLHFRGGFVEWDDARDLEECDHHDGVCALSAEAGLRLDDLFGIDIVELNVIFDDVFLHVTGEAREHFIVGVG